MLRFVHTRVLVFALGLLGTMFVLAGAAHAQGDGGDLTPIANDVPRTSFRTLPTVAAPTPSTTIVQETTPQIAPKDFTDLMLGWNVTTPAGASVTLEVRVSRDGTRWTPWAVIVPDTEIPDEQQRWSDIFYVGQARFFQLRMIQTPNAAGEVPTVTDLKAHTLYVEDMPLQEAPKPLPGTESTSLGMSPDAELAAVTRPTYVSRTGWGNPDGESAPDAPPRYRKATHIVIHHTAESNTLGTHPNWASRVRAIWTYHAKTQGWGDIGYNWIIDPNGVIYAGRAGYNHADLDPAGFHDAANHGSVGISIMGTYSTVAPSAAAQNSLVNLMAWKAAQRGIDPLGKGAYYGCVNSRYCAPYVPGGILPFITAHRDVMPGQTTCPGDAFYNLVPQLRQRVATLIKQGGTGGTVTPTPTPVVRTDNGDLVLDNQETTFTWTGEMSQSACGFNGTTNWTYASSEADSVTNDVTGVWKPTIKTAGYYRVWAHIPNCTTPTTLTTNARYQITHAGGTSTVVVNQQTQRGWVDLGAYQFASGTNGAVRLTDLTDEAFGQQRGVLFDAVKWEPASPPTPAPCTLQATLRTNGSIAIAINCPDTTATTFEIQVRDMGTGQVRTLFTKQKTLTFFGTPGNTYEFRMRASNGTTWTALSSTVEATVRVPTTTSFTRIAIPRVVR